MDGFGEFEAGGDDEGRRLDRLARRLLPGIPLSALHKALRTGRIRLNGVKAAPEERVSAGDRVEISSSLMNGISRDPRDRPNPGAPPTPGSADLRRPPGMPPILLETADLLFIDKPLGLLVHDGEDSAEAAVRRYLQPALPPSLAFRPGPLHRLDRNTSGVLAFSKSLEGARVFSLALREGRLAKTYLAVLEGGLEEAQTWSDNLTRDGASRLSRVGGDAAAAGTKGGPAGKQALTRVFPLKVAGGRTFACLRLETGRSHQIRAQAAARAHPLAGDLKYGGKSCARPYYLHAWLLEAGPAADPLLPALVRAPLPDYFRSIVADVFSLDEKEVYSRLRQIFP